MILLRFIIFLIFEIKKVMKKLLFILLFIPLFLSGQETEKVFKVTTTKGEVIRASSYRVNEKRKTTDIKTVDGKIISLKSSKVSSIIEIKEGWDYFEFKEEGFTDYVAVEIDSLNKEEIYTQVKNWILDTYNTPSEVIKSEIKNKKIRIEGSKPNVLSRKVLLSTFYYDIIYSVEISVRDGKYKFDPISTKYWTDATKYAAGGYNSLSIFNKEQLTGYYHQKGKKKGRLKSFIGKFPIQLENHFNNLNLSLYNYIQKNKNNSEEGSDDDW